MAEELRLVLDDGTVLKDPCEQERKDRLARLEVIGKGRRKLVFYTRPKESIFFCQTDGGEGKLHVEARVNCLFRDEKLVLHAILDRTKDKLEKLAFGGKFPQDILARWRDDTITEKSFTLLKRHLPHEADLFQTKVGSNLELSDSSSFRNLALKVIFLKIADEEAWTPVFHSWPRLRRRTDSRPAVLRAYGISSEVPHRPEPDVQLVQLPESIFRPAGDRSAIQKWFVAVRGLPYRWGQAVWHDLLAEHIRVSALDIPHASFFTPLLDAEGSPDLEWDLLLEVQEGQRNVAGRALHLRAWKSAKEERLRARFPLLRDHEGAVVEGDLPLRKKDIPKQDAPWRKRNTTAGDFADLHELFGLPGLSLKLHTSETITAAGSPAVRIGALDVRFSGSPLTTAGAMDSRLRWNLVPSGLGEREEAYQAKEAFLDLQWAVQSASPGGQDDLAGELHLSCDEESLQALEEEEKRERELECRFQRERPLVIPLPPLSGQERPERLILEVSERSRQRDARRVDLTLRRPTLAADAAAATLEASLAPGSDDLLKTCSEDPDTVATSLDRVAVLDREPFVVAKVSFPSLGTLKNPAANNEVANWRSYGPDAGAWHVRFPDAQNFCLTLPPQGVGETMEKKRGQGLEENELADFRLSPPALLSMRETFFRQNFPEAPWNLRRLLSDPGRELPGAHLEHLQYELLYGLSCRVDYPFMRLAELTALVGDVMGPLPEQPRWGPLQETQGVKELSEKARKDYREARSRWAVFSQRTRQRLGIFELWDIRRLDTLELKEGVTCWIRQRPEDDTKAPSELVKVQEAQIANPFLPLDEGENKDKLKGGVTWGFESRNVYQAVVREGPADTWPKSSGAEMKETRLSALGGYGHQMAAFDNWRTKILADVSMGRTYSYTLERIGRIGVWWNRAKHVIIYQRTVVPSRQFAGDQNPHEGRAVLRKVEEYVEILQNDRKYPDSPEGFPRATGFVTACSFSDDPNQVVRFRVRSSWGSDIGQIGWKVPIWRPNEKPEDLYPKPVVNLVVLASVDGASVPRKAAIADPENLFFFTDTTVPPEALDNPSVDLSNTDAWPPVEGVDFVDESRPAPSPDKAFASGALRQSGAGDVALPSGFRPCTFQLEPAEHAVDLLANRRGDPMGALLSSVTFCRAKLEEARQGLAAEYRTSLRSIEDQATSLLQRLPAAGSLPSGFDLTTGLRDLCDRATAEAGSLDTRIRQIQGTQLDDIIDKAIDQAVQNIDRVLEGMLGRAEASDLGRSLQRSLEFLRNSPGNLEAVRLQLVQEISREVDTLAQRVEALLPSPTVLTDSVQAALREARGNLDLVRTKSQELRRRILGGLGGAAEIERIDSEAQAYVRRLDDALGRLQQLAESGARIKLELGGAEKTLPFVRGVQKAVEFIRQQAQGLEKGLSQAREAVALLANWRGRFDDMIQPARDRVVLLLKAATAWIDGAGQLLASLDTEIDSLEAIQTEIRELKEDWADRLKTTLSGAVNDIITQVPVPELPFPGQWTDALRAEKTRLLDDLAAKARERKPDHEKWFTPPPPIQDRLTDLCSDLQARLRDFLAGAGGEVAAIRRFLEDRRDEVLRNLDQAFGDEIRMARKILGELEPEGHKVLNLVRAFGQPPDVSGLRFDRPEVAFFYNEIKDHVDITPVIARAAQAGAVLDALKPFGVDLPVQQLAEQLIPASLKNFDLSAILPNIAGIPLQNLFSGLKLPDLGSDAVKVRHGVDPQNRRAWVNTDVNFEIPGNATLFAVGPLAVRVEKPHFQAVARMEADPRGIQQRSVNGHLSGSWQLQVGGFELITFKDTPLEFDDSGRVRFEVEPRNVVMAPALSFINDLMTKISPGGLTTRFDGDGVVSTLDLPIPDTQIGAFGFAGLRLGASLALRFSGGDFNIGVTASLGRRDAPFTLTIFVLGGGGYLELGSRYHPSTGRVTATADLAIAASASLAIALGPIRGGVAVYVGVTAQYDSARGGGLVVGLMFMVRGHVSVLSIASATVTLRLDGQYQGGVLVGRGHLEIKIKICWCFTLEVSESVTYTLGRVGSAQNSRLNGPRPVARLASLGSPADLLADASGGAGNNVTGLNPEALKKGVEAYVDMLV